MIEDVSGFVIDMDGTVYIGGEVIPGATEFIGFLRSKGIPFVFLTNNSSRSRGYYLEKVRDMGLDASIENILTSAVATERFLLDQRPGKRVYVLATPEVQDEMREAGIPLTEEDPDIVLLTFDRTITFDKINKAYSFIMAGAELVATHPDHLCPTEGGYDVDIGAFICMFEYLTGRKATVVGKPNPLMLDMAAAEMGAERESTVMVGDRLYTDMRMAQDCGIRSILVLSGETTEEDLRGSSMRPTYVVGSVGEIPGLL